MRYITPLLLSALFAGCFKEHHLTEPTGGCPPAEACSDKPVAVIGGHQFTSLAAGRYHTCGRKSSGEVWCWGSNVVGQLGNSDPGASSGTPLKVAGSQSFLSVSAGEFHTCGLATDAGLYCWGNNSTQVLGTATTEVCGTTPCSHTPLRAAGPSTFTSFVAGVTHTCGLDSSGGTQCWGFNVLGETGSTNYGTSSATPVTVSGGKTFAKIAAGYRFTCGLDSSGSLFCWGYGEEGQLATISIADCTTGSASYHCSAVPVAASSSEHFTQIVAGAAYGCGLATQATIFCWGYGGEGQLGTGAFQISATPLALAGTGTWSSVAAGYFHACALRTDGSAYCWGANTTAQLGDGTKVYANASPQPVIGGKTFTQLVAGANHTCGLAADGTAWCWGGDTVHQLGRG